ncbi:hypothetical protein MF406_12795 [Georgenia sp. TF02-10]|uniref:hypothetical protein n=1 Tax=Georgenia sp. TF02-10 TaxID=2917725 RepID=UPI001FA777AB|nr:hypothetical protein [Georgenia sp. TF02-10]UNX53847.1 hypothetical protein MF406_12795 [Georgenia sp. TF02-10]
MTATEPRTGPQTDGESLVSILDELTTLISQARTMPMSASVLVNRAEALDLLDAARAVVPEEIHAADDIVAGADAVMEQARRRAEQVLADAETRAKELVAQERVVRLAEERAEQIVAAAEARAAKLAADANDYCDRQLAQFEIDLGAITTQVRAGREALAARNRPAGE